MTFIIEGKPVAQGRPRFTRTGHAYDPPKSREYKKLVALRAKTAMQGKELVAKPCPLSVTIVVYMKLPKSFPKQKRMMARDKILLPIKKPDIDNLAKGILDGAKGIIFEDDAQIVSLTCRKYYAENPRAEVTITKTFDGLDNF